MRDRDGSCDQCAADQSGGHVGIAVMFVAMWCSLPASGSQLGFKSDHDGGMGLNLAMLFVVCPWLDLWRNPAVV